jgi:hypothetical protein
LILPPSAQSATSSGLAGKRSACPFLIGRRTARPTTELLLDMCICSCELSVCRGAKKSDPSLPKRHRVTQRFGGVVRPGALRIDSKNCTSI